MFNSSSSNINNTSDFLSFFFPFADVYDTQSISRMGEAHSASFKKTSRHKEVMDIVDELEKVYSRFGLTYPLQHETSPDMLIDPNGKKIKNTMNNRKILMLRYFGKDVDDVQYSYRPSVPLPKNEEEFSSFTRILNPPGTRKLNFVNN